MKIILSRKGFDSTYGGHPSPILPNGELLSLPIPSEGDGIFFRDLANYRYREVMGNLFSSIRLGNYVGSLDEFECHLDPDLIPQTLPRDEGWRGSFGQAGAAQGHLENENVSIGDLFLFFGWFRKTELRHGRLRYVPRAPNLHVLFGFLEIDEIYKNNFPNWLNSHPHVWNRQKRKLSKNAIYVGKNQSSFGNFPGYGIFHFHENLILTKQGMTRSRWDLPSFFRDVSISYHRKNAWKNGYFQSVAKGQEFVIEENSLVTNWAKELIISHRI